MNAGVAAQYRAVDTGGTADVIDRHGELVRRIAHHLAARLPSSVEVDDLIQSGMLGLLEAAQNFRSGQGATFETYASIRIRGAMIDEVRRGDWVPRSVHRSYRDAIAATRAVEQRLGRPAGSSEIAREMGISLDEYRKLQENAARGRLVSLEMHANEYGGNLKLAWVSGDTPVREFLRDSFREELAKAVGKLPEREQLVLSLYYDKELNLREIGEVLGVSESRVCQIHGQAAIRLRAQLADWQVDDVIQEDIE